MTDAKKTEPRTVRLDTQADWIKTSLRLDPELHAIVHEEATNSGRTFNAEIGHQLRRAYVKPKQQVIPGNGQTPQPEALRLAAWLKAGGFINITIDDTVAIVNELVTQHEQITELQAREPSYTWSGTEADDAMLLLTRMDDSLDPERIAQLEKIIPRMAARIAELEAENRALKEQSRAGMLIDPDPTPQIAPSGHVFHTAGIGTLKGAWEVGWNAACDHHDIKSLREQIAQQESIGAGGVTGLRNQKPTRPGLYAWHSEGRAAIVLVDKRPSSVSPGNQLNGHVINSTRFYDGCGINDWGRDGSWVLLHDFNAAIAQEGGKP